MDMRMSMRMCMAFTVLYKHKYVTYIVNVCAVLSYEAFEEERNAFDARGPVGQPEH